ncbi:hypothetical protein H9P43_001630 [Blastocladiella emersonii ATCC 22665]|nr:hypothetical protein H9P43_001630 [Blastocladiella emersonii ATCC 22665]
MDKETSPLLSSGTRTPTSPPRQRQPLLTAAGASSSVSPTTSPVPAAGLASYGSDHDHEAANDYGDDTHLLSPTERERLANDTTIPRSVYFIVGNEFCERFAFYGIKAVLFIYLTRYLQIGSDTSTALVHTFTMAAYTATLLGGVLSDSYLGRFRTILYLSLVYCVGNLLLSVTAIPGVMSRASDGSVSPMGAFAGLTLLAIGTGGIKPCVSAFGADQFHATQVRGISIFSLFYFAINSGSLLSMFITPVLRSQSCFGRSDCFPLAFGLPSGLMLVSTLVFISGRAYYRQTPPEGNVLARVLAAIRFARAERARSPDASKSHWIDYAAADPRFDAAFLADVKQLLRVVWVFLPLPLFWTLFDQQASRWTSQALLMKADLDLFGWVVAIKPDQMQVANALLILAFIPLFQRFVYPNFAVLKSPLRRMAIGMSLAGCSFILAGLLQLRIDRAVYAAYENGQLVDVVDPATRSKLAEQGSLVCVSGCVPILWQVPQYMVITAGEILFSITGLEFAYSQSPPSLKSVCQSAWQMTVAVGNLLVIIIAESRMFDAAPELFFFASALFVATGIFVVMSRDFRFVRPAAETYSNEEDVM